MGAGFLSMGVVNVSTRLKVGCYGFQSRANNSSAIGVWVRLGLFVNGSRAKTGMTAGPCLKWEFVVNFVATQLFVRRCAPKVCAPLVIYF